MIGLHDEINERLELRTTDDLVGEYRPELAGYLASQRLGNLLEEVFVPLCATTRTRSAVAYEERPWPPAGVGARGLRGLAFAVISEDSRALLTPPTLAPAHATNIGLAAALTRHLLNDLTEQGVTAVSVFVNERSKVVAAQLAITGFVPHTARVLTGQTQFVAYTAEPSALLDALELGEPRLGDILALKMSQSAIARLTGFHLALAAGLTNYWADRVALAEVFPGLIDWASSPPGGISGTPGPKLPSDDSPDPF